MCNTALMLYLSWLVSVMLLMVILLPAEPLTLITFVVLCAAASVEGVASQAGAPPPETAEALEAGKHHS